LRTAVVFCAVSALCACRGDDAPGVVRAQPSPQSADARAMLDNPSSPASTVRRLWRYMQRGALLPAVLVYHPALREAVGDRDFAAVVAAQQVALAGIRPRVIDVEETAAGRLITVEAIPQTGDATRYSYVLRRDPQGWVIVYDTLMADAIGRVITSRVQSSIDPNASTPAARAVDTGNRVADAFREAALQASEATRTNSSP
jgi:hypothetical protein